MDSADETRTTEAVGTRYGVDASRASSAESSTVLATRAPTCRVHVTGTEQVSTIKVEEQDRERTSNVRSASFIVGGLTFGAGFLAWVFNQPQDTYAYPSEAKSAEEGRKAGKTMMLLAPVFAAPGIVSWFMPQRRETVESTKQRPVDRWDGAPFPCEGAVPEPNPGVTIVATTRFKQFEQVLTQKSVAAKNGVAKIDLRASGLVAGFCGEGAVELAPELTGGAGGAEIVPATLRLPARSAPGFANIAALDPGAVPVATACCKRNVVASSAASCEERCARAGGVERCLFGRRACAMKAERGEDLQKGLKLCDVLYRECLVGNGTSEENVLACATGCGDQLARETCR